jgi:hypothetical protein
LCFAIKLQSCRRFKDYVKRIEECMANADTAKPINVETANQDIENMDAEHNTSNYIGDLSFVQFSKNWFIT